MRGRTLFLIIIFCILIMFARNNLSKESGGNPTTDASDTTVSNTGEGVKGNVEFINPEGDVVLNARDIASAEAIQTSQPDGYIAYEVKISLTAEGTGKFARVSGNLIGNYVDLYIDHRSVSRFMLSTVVYDGKIILSGYSTKEETEQLVKRIRGR